MSEPPPRYVEPIATRLRERPAKPPAVDLAGHDAQEGTCHKCGGLMLRGRPDDARLCGKCGTRYHASDCGKRLHTCGLMKKAEMCPKVRVTARAARRSTRGRSLPNTAQCARVFLPPPPTRALTERRRARPSQCHGLCSCSGGPIRCHVTVMRVSRLSRSRDEAEGAVFDGDGGVALDDDSPIEGNGVAIGGSNARAGGEGNARNGAKIGELSPQLTYAPVGHSGHAADEATPDVAIDKNALATLGFFVPETAGGTAAGPADGLSTRSLSPSGAAEINGFDPAALFKYESPPKLDDDSPPKLTPRPSDASRITRSEPSSAPPS